MSFIHYLALYRTQDIVVEEVAGPGTSEPAPEPMFPYPPRDPEPAQPTDLPPITRASGPPEVIDMEAVLSNSGACASGAATSYATVTVSWRVPQAANPDYVIYVYDNGARVAILDATSGSYVSEIAGWVANAPYHRWSFKPRYRVDVVLAADNTVVSSSERSVFLTLGKCSA